MQVIWILAALVAAPATGGDKVVDPDAKPMGPALVRGAPETQHTVRDEPLPPLPEHPEPPPGTLDVHDHGAAAKGATGQAGPMFPAEPGGDELGAGAKAAGALGIVALAGALAWAVRRRQRA